MSEQAGSRGTDAETTGRTGEDETGAAGDAGAAAGDAAPPETADGRLRARLRPAGGEADPGSVRVTVYVVTGRHGGLTIPESFCRECHLFARRADAAAERVDSPVDVEVVSWYTNVLSALRHGGYHPPVMVVGGRRLCQGHDVPTVEAVVDAIERAAE